MRLRKFVIWTTVAALMVLTGCAASPDKERRRAEMEADVDEIVGYQLDESEVGSPKDCLSKTEVRSFRALGERHLLFVGRGDKMWVNVLRGRCSGLRHDHIFVMKKTSGERTCNLDPFEVIDRNNLSYGGVGTGMGCTLGKFRPILKAQVEEIENRLKTK